MSDEELAAVAEKQPFCKTISRTKAHIIHLLKTKGHKIGYMGDGINDAYIPKKWPTLEFLWISAVDIAKGRRCCLLDKDFTRS